MLAVGFAGPGGAILAGAYYVGNNWILRDEGGLFKAGYHAWKNANNFK